MMSRPLVLTALLLLAACGDDAPATDEGGREASGEVLEGSISDAMLPIEDVRSQPPLAGGSEDGDGETDSDADAPASAASASSRSSAQEPVQEPAETPAEEPAEAPAEPAAED
ncbi:hypothetical protein GRI62_01660 [Erythrobacter arachoides]|uniref:Uncharacterized protein n=1 Tax=Aurantiacibacter arachoides TaxID=1850444 RepID=A0A844ZYJ3_9SPHN|nr:hypothetical protein [Aurantiacibacter arachoides]MXO92312.1 hypothetical protein [Aurantiacibacter arachoides]GGD58143.1 hypothetical protein GCM10011411_17790 [Aurantiacibacter arachoides]